MAIRLTESRLRQIIREEIRVMTEARESARAAAKRISADVAKKFGGIEMSAREADMKYDRVDGPLETDTADVPLISWQVYSPDEFDRRGELHGLIIDVRSTKKDVVDTAVKALADEAKVKVSNMKPEHDKYGNVHSTRCSIAWRE